MPTRAGLTVAFRVDASLAMGTGHVMRCLTLANALRAQGAACRFVGRPHAGHLLAWVAQQGFEVMALPALPALPALTTATQVPAAGPAHAAWLGTDWATDAAQTRQTLGTNVVDWLVVDHYALDAPWEQALRPACRRLLVIDDLADRAHDCDVLLDQNLGRVAGDYAGLTAAGTPLLAGPSYALLRPEFALLRAASLARRAVPQLQRLLVTLGGVDAHNATGAVLNVLQASPLPAGLQVTVVMGAQAPWLAQVQAQAAAMPCPTRVLVGVSHMAELMMQSDLAIGAAGSTAWERCCLGLPSLVLVLADNQRPGATALQAAGAARVVASVDEIPALLARYAADAAGAADAQRAQQFAEPADKLSLMSQAAQQVTDGLGAARVVQHLLAQHLQDHHA